MHNLLPGFALVIFAMPAAGLGQTGTCEKAFEAELAAGGRLALHVRSGSLEIVGTESPKLRVTCEVKRLTQEERVKIEFRRGELRIYGGSDDRHFRVRVEVPKQCHLLVRVPAGELRINDVIGDKDVEVHAGDVTISVGNASDYAHADASVTAGDLTASPFGVIKGGLFRSFEKNNPGGKYRLHARLWAGDLVLR
jgi:hypothetical protein